MMALAVIAIVVLIGIGSWVASSLDVAIPALIARRPVGDPILAPLRRGSALLLQQRVATERPDLLNWLLAPAAYLVLAAIGMSVVPFALGFVAVPVSTGIVVWGACEALTVVVVFLHGWSANAPFPLIGAYRYVAIGLPAMLVSMFVLIGVSLPAQSLDVTSIVESQRYLWNVVRQPLGLPLFMLLGLSLTLRGPLDYADPFDLAGGTTAEDSGALRASWQLARLAMLVSFSTMAATMFLGGYLGPWLPGPVWLVAKILLVMAIVITAGHWLARTSPSRMLTLLWLVFLPLAFLDLIVAGLESLA